MHKVRQIADGMIVWKGDAVIGIKGATLPAMFDDCDCSEVGGNEFDYELSPDNEYTEEQAAFIEAAEKEWSADDEDTEEQA